MSLVGVQPVPIPKGVKVSIDGRTLSFDSGNEKREVTHHPTVFVDIDHDQQKIVVRRKDDEWVSKCNHGTTRSLINNILKGLSEGFKKELDIVGVGWNAKVQGDKLALSVGYADTKMVPIPAGVKVDVQNNTHIVITGTDKQAVGQLAANVRGRRPPEPYNGKGIKYSDEVIQRKAGKAFGG